jgi:hypothetical protein
VLVLAVPTMQTGQIPIFLPLFQLVEATVHSVGNLTQEMAVLAVVVVQTL